MLCLFVERGADFVQQHDTARPEQSSGDGNALRLTLAQSSATLAALGIQTFWQVQHKVGHRRMEHLPQFLVGGVGLGQLEIIADAATHERIALWHKHEVGPRMLADGLPVVGIEKFHTALTGLDESEQQSEQGSLARACMSHQGRLTACRKLMGKVGEDLAVASGIAETDILNLQT